MPPKICSDDYFEPVVRGCINLVAPMQAYLSYFNNSISKKIMLKHTSGIFVLISSMVAHSRPQENAFIKGYLRDHEQLSPMWITGMETYYI
jgi:hypothetical protein